VSYFAPKQDEVGTIKDFGQAALPGGWILCDGAAVSRASFAALFAAIGVVWGVGDGATTFNVPDCLGRSRIGRGQGAGLTNRALADSGGAEVAAPGVSDAAAPGASDAAAPGATDGHALVTAEVPTHAHGEKSNHATKLTGTNGEGGGQAGTDPVLGTATANATQVLTDSAGGGGAHVHAHSATHVHAHSATHVHAHSATHNNMEPFKVVTVGIRA
jgi:hypothetical protein